MPALLPPQALSAIETARRAAEADFMRMLGHVPVLPRRRSGKFLQNKEEECERNDLRRVGLGAMPSVEF
jgi:hypothetical protein